MVTSYDCLLSDVAVHGQPSGSSEDTVMQTVPVIDNGLGGPDAVWHRLQLDAHQVSRSTVEQAAVQEWMNRGCWVESRTW